MINEIQIDEEAFNALVLLSGSHKDVSDGVCAMEAVAFLAGEKHSDAPDCACRVLAAFVRSVNDRWDDENRQRLIPYLPRLIGTRDPAKLVPRAYMAADWAVRESMPRWLDYLAMPVEAAEMRALPPIVDKASARGGSEASRRVRALIWKKYPAAYAGAAAYAAAAYAADAAADYAAYAAADYAADYAYDPSKRAAFEAHIAAQNASVLELLGRMIEA